MKKRRVVAMIMFILIMTSVFFAGCKKEVSNTPEETGKTENQSQETEKKAEEEAKKDTDPYGKYDEQVVLTAVGGVRPPEQPEVPAGTTPENQSFIKICEDTLNVTIEYLWTVPDEQFEQKFKLSLASGDVPDIMKVSQQQFDELIEAGALADLTDIYETYAIPEMKADYEGLDNVPLKAATRDGKLYGMPYAVDPHQEIQLLWIRADWLKKLNLDPPKTIEDLEKIAEAFVKNDPDGNGKDDTYGLGIAKDFYSGIASIKGFAQGFHAYPAWPEAWIKGSDGTLVFSEIQPEMKEALLGLQNMYQKGLIDREFATKDLGKVVEDIVAGKIGIVYGEWWVPAWPLNLNKDNEPEADWKCYPIVSADDKPALTKVNRVNVPAYNVVSKNCKNPEAAMKVMNVYWDILFNKDPESRYGDLVKAENGFVYHYPPIYNYMAMTQENNYKLINEALKNNDPSTLISSEQKNIYESSQKYLGGDQSGSSWGFYFSRIEENGGWGTTRKVRDAGHLMYNEYFGPATPTQVEKGSTLEKMKVETFTRIIMGAPIEEFDKFVTDWKKLGGDDITAEVNEWYKDNKMN